MEEGAENDGARKRRKPPRGADAGGGNNGGDNGGALTGLAAVQGVFHFLPAPADVLRAATACRRWRELACADSVWRARFEREGLLEKAGVFEVALPAVPVQGGQGGAAAPTAAALVVKDEAAGVGLAFYARIFTLKVVQFIFVLRSLRAAFLCTYLIGASRTRHPPPLCRGTR